MGARLILDWPVVNLALQSFSFSETQGLQIAISTRKNRVERQSRCDAGERFFLQVVAWGECFADCASGGIAVGGTTVAIPLVVALNILTSIDLLTDGEGSLHGVP